MMLGRALCRLARDLPAALAQTDAATISEATQDKLGIVCRDPVDALAEIVTELGVPCFGITHPPHHFAQLLLFINRVPVACYTHLGGVCGERSANTFAFIHTFLRNCNVAGAGAAYIADIESPATLWDRPCRRREWEAGRRLRHSLRRASKAAGQCAVSPIQSNPGWHVWQAPRRASWSSSSDDSGSDHNGSDDSSSSSSSSSRSRPTSGCGGCGDSAPHHPALLREYMQRPNLRAFAAFVHGGAQALCDRLRHDGRHPDLVFIDTGCVSRGSRRTMSVLTRDFHAMHALSPKILVVDGIRPSPCHHGSRLWANVKQLACYDSMEFGDVGLLCRH